MQQAHMQQAHMISISPGRGLPWSSLGAAPCVKKSRRLALSLPIMYSRLKVAFHVSALLSMRTLRTA
jgi:hypothetical protein